MFRSPGGAVALVLVVSVLLGAVALDAHAQDRPDALELYRDGRYERAIEVTLEEIEEQPRNMDAYTVLGWSLLALGRYEDALEYGLNAMEISRFDARIIYIVGEAHRYLGNFEESLSYLEEYVAVDPNGRQVHQVYYNMGEVFLELEEYNHADAALSTAVHFDDDRASWWSRLGVAREQAGDYEHAEEAYERALELDQDLDEASEGLERVREELEG